MYFSDTMVLGESSVPSLVEFASQHPDMNEEMIRRDDLPKEVFQDYYRTIIREDRLPVLNSTTVVSVTLREDTRTFVVQTASGEEITSQVVVDATGIVWNKAWPEWTNELDKDRVFHSIGHGALSDLRDKRILVVGGGHATPDIATRMREQGAAVTVVIRSSKLKPHFLPYDQTYISPQFQQIYRACDHHAKYRLLRFVQKNGPWVTPRSYGEMLRNIHSNEEAGDGHGIEFVTSSEVVMALETSEGIEAHLSNGWTREVDYIICATGFLAKMPIDTSFEWRGFNTSKYLVGGYPKVDDNYEWTACEGAFFAGYLAQLGPRGPIDSILFGTQESVARTTAGIVSRLGVRH